MDRTRVLAAGLLVGLGAAVGCLNTPLVKDKADVRSQVADDAPADVTVGQRTMVGNVDPIPVHGVGLVHKLAGTGSSPPPDGYRAALEQAIRRQKGDPKALLDDPGKSTTLVLVSALIPPGARAGDRVDVTVALPPNTKTTSLKGGVLWPCELTTMELAGGARHALQQAGVPVGGPVADAATLLKGHKLAVAEGPLVAGFDGPAAGDANPADGPKAARVWQGAKCGIDRAYYILLNDPQPRLAMVVAERLNAVFHAPGDRAGKLAEAKPHGGKPLVVTHVPPAYRHNHPRFLLVARQVPLTPAPADGPLRRRLENDLLRPETALVAALQLEALGVSSEHALRVGLQSDSPWVKFAAAESLAYLGKADARAADELKDLAVKHPSLRAHCLKALASQDDAYCLDHLADLMKHPDPALRYGAFAGLRTADEGHEAAKGARVGDSFWVHQVAPNSDPLVHVGTAGRAEVVLFGTSAPLTGRFAIPLGKAFTVSAGGDDPVATVTRVAHKDGEPTLVPVKCRADLASVLKTLGDLGGTYAEAVEFVRRAAEADALAAKVEYDAAPKGLSVQHLAQIARADPSLARADLEVARAGAGDVVPAGYDLPTEGDAVQARPKPADEDGGPALNRMQGGRLFGPKRADADK